VAPEPTSTRRCGLKLQLTWQRVDARHAPYLVFRVPTEALWPTSGEAANPQVGPIFGTPFGYLELFSWHSTVGPLGCCRYVRQRPPLKLKKTSTAGPLGVLSVFPATATTEVEDVDGGPP
jgi:hypothetical protein